MAGPQHPGSPSRPSEPDAEGPIDTVVVPRVSDIGGFQVRRALPTRRKKLVGPFIFFDRMGPARLGASDALDVQPHPHIGLATVTYLYEGRIRHLDSLGTDQVIEPGAINLMTAGRGIVHSERSPAADRGTERGMSGLQIWLALPEGAEESAPAFEHTPADALPTVEDAGFRARVLMGTFLGATSPVTQSSETLYVDAVLPPGGALELPTGTEERAAYVLSGDVVVAGERFEGDALIVFRPGDPIVLRSERGASLVVLGGAALEGPRHIWWNFVSSSKERIEAAKADWKARRFDAVPGDEIEFVPLPER